MNTFEYKLMPVIPAMGRGEVEEYLNDYGYEGWELVGLDYGSFIFKRQLSPYASKTRSRGSE